MGPSAEFFRLTDEQRCTLQGDLERARLVFETEMLTKLDYWQRLPWLLCGLAHESEQTAREIGAKALAQFQQDPRQVAHHRKTWRLLQEGAEFREGLELFVSGHPRWLCGDAFTVEISIFRFYPVAETTIEAKHSRATLEGRRHSISAVRISLSNRLGMMQRMLERDPTCIADLVDHFEVARSMLSIGPALGLEGHPCLLSARKKSWSLKVMLTKVIYMCDMQARYATMLADMKYHDKAHRKARTAQHRLSINHVAVSEPGVLKHAMLGEM